jgi:WD40 repeat protein
VHFVAHDRDRDALVARGVYKHHPEIWDLQPSPTSDALVATLYNPSSPSQNHGGAVWRVPGDGEDTSGSKALESVAPFPETNGAARCVRWRVGVGVDPSAPATGGTLAVADEKTLRLFQLDASSDSAMAIAAESAPFGDAPGAPVAGAWDPHTTTSFAIVSGTHGALHRDDGVCVYDTRTMRVSVVIPNPSSSRRAGCRFADVEFDPRRPNKAFTAGDDGLARAWDLRKPTDPTSVFAGHEHWVRRVCANPVYDLLVTASADGTARLWRHGETCDTREDDEERKTTGGDFPATKTDDDDVGPVETYGAPGGTSVCGVAWSFADPWSFASLEGDGAVALRVVPRAEKYRILL